LSDFVSSSPFAAVDGAKFLVNVTGNQLISHGKRRCDVRLGHHAKQNLEEFLSGCILFQIVSTKTFLCSRSVLKI